MKNLVRKAGWYAMSICEKVADWAWNTYAERNGLRKAFEDLGKPLRFEK